METTRRRLERIIRSRDVAQLSLMIFQPSSRSSSAVSRVNLLISLRYSDKSDWTDLLPVTGLLAEPLPRLTSPPFPARSAVPPLSAHKRRGAKGPGSNPLSAPPPPGV